MMRMSAEAREKLTEPWEAWVPYPYDDKVPPQRIGGRLQYVEWKGGEIKGTITQGFGHTDAAGEPEIMPGVHWSREQGDEVLSRDLADCEHEVNRRLKVKVTQHQFDALVDTWLNCPKATVAAIDLINAGNARAVPGKLLQYTYSRGEHMDGLVHRRNAEIAWLNTPDHIEGPAAPHPDIAFCPKGERNPPPKTMLQSKTGTAAATTGAASLAIAVQSANAALEPIMQAKGSLQDLGVFDHLDLLTHNTTVLMCAVVAAFAVFIWFDRRNRLVNDHV
jgi:GH24 family phage-related lysozyme (muramidase)